MNKENTKNIIKKILIMLVIIIILGVILTMGIGNYFVNYAIARSGDGGNREIKDDSKIEVLGEDEKIIESNRTQAKESSKKWDENIKNKV